MQGHLGATHDDLTGTVGHTGSNRCLCWLCCGCAGRVLVMGGGSAGAAGIDGGFGGAAGLLHTWGLPKL